MASESSASAVRLVVGLGNPGREYQGTRHNVGFDVVDRLAKEMGCSLRNKSKFDAEVGEAVEVAGKVVLAKPQTFMNRSGVSVQSVAAWLKVAPVHLMVVVDDADLPLGQIRVRSKGGSGGHNGLRSIIESLGGCEDFPRIRLGIGRSGPAGTDISDHVLSRFRAEERAAAAEMVERAAAAVRCWLAEGIDAAMNKFNRKQTDPEQGNDKGKEK